MFPYSVTALIIAQGQLKTKLFTTKGLGITAFVRIILHCGKF